ncbi:RING finger-like protein, partial [Trifolium medium]|nr:RING finger-like protein [Trifolium medium]
GRVYRFQAPTLVPVRPSSYVPPQRPLSISAPSSGNYRLNAPPPPPGLGFSTTLEANRYVQTNSRLTRSENRVRLG